MSNRRAFLGTVAALGTGAVLAPERAFPRSGPENGSGDAWLDQLKGKHRQLFDAPDPDGGTILRHVRTYLDVWRSAYAVPEKDVSVVVTFYARTTPLGLQDAMWEKYKLGAALSLTDPATHAPLARNYFAHPRPGDGVGDGTPDSSIEALLRRGVTFLLCNNALLRWSGRLEHQGLGAAADIHADLTAHALPGVIIVPDVIIAMTKAQERDFGYVRS
jgi:hypothetical protein